LDLKYPEIDKNLKILDVIKEEYNDILKLHKNTFLKDDNIKSEYKYRLKDFNIIINIIENFYNKDEADKFNLINKYF